MASYNFSILSGYKNALDRLKAQIKVVSDDTPTQIFTDNNIFDYSHNLGVAVSNANFPLCVLKVTSEEMKSESRQNSNLVIEMFQVFNNQDKDFYIELNQIVSTFRKTFAETYRGEFVVTNIERDEIPSELNANLNKFKPFWSVKYTIEYNNTKY